MNKKIKNIIKLFLALFIVTTSFANLSINSKAAEGRPHMVRTLPGTGAKVYQGSDMAWWGDGIGIIEVNGELVFCIEPTTLGLEGDYFEVSDLDGETWQTISRIVYYGWDSTSKSDDDYATTQYMVWEELGANITFLGDFGNRYPNLKADVFSRMANHEIKPSFNNSSYTLNVNETLRINDDNNILSDFHIANSNGVNVSIDGNELVITGEVSSPDDATVILRKIPSQYVGTNIAYKSSHGNGQDVGLFRMPDPLYSPINFHFNKFGQLDLFKKDEDENAVEGIGFDIVNKTTGDVQSAVTDANGKINLDLLPDDYTAYETTTLPHLVLDSTPQDFTIKPNETISLDFTNKWVVGNSEIVKVDTNGNVIKVKGTEYDIFSPTGEFLEHTVSGADGKAVTKYYRYADGYKYIETKAPDGYILDSTPVYFNIRENMQTVTVEKENKRAIGEVILNKEDIETGTTPQGDASLIGAGFTLFANKDIPDPSDPTKVLVNKGTSLGEQIMDENLQLKWTDIYLSKDADNYRVEETKIPIGYLKAEDILLSLNYKDDKTPVTSTSKTAYEQVMKRDVHGYKFATDGSVGTINPLAGAEFTYKLKSEVAKVGWDAARSYAIATSDEKGEWWAKDLPYGIFTQRETYTPLNHISVPDMDIVVDSNDSDPIIVYLNDPIYDAYLRFAKKDLATDANVTLSNAKLQIFHEDGTIVREKNGLFYKDVFTTDENGYLELNKTLPADKYYAVELGTLPGFLTPQNRFEFEISADGEIIGVNEEDSKPIILVKIYNERPTVEIKLEKLFEFFEGNPNPEALFEFRVRDKEISPVDGSVMYEEGEVLLNPERSDGLWSVKDAETITIDSLYFGTDNELVILAEEKSTSPEYVPHTDILEFVITKKDDTTKVYTSSQTLENKLKRTDLVVNKIDEYTRGKLEDYSNIELTLFKDKELSDIFAKVEVDPVTGQVKFNDIVYGSHLFLKETSTNSKYYLNDEVIELVFDNDLEGIGDTHTLDYANKPVPTMTTLASGINGKKTLDRNVDNELFDEMSLFNIDISDKYDIYSEFVEYESEEAILSSTVTDVKFDNKDVVYEISQTAKAHTLDADRYYYRQRVFLAGSDPEVDTPIVEHDDKESLDQTIRFTTSKIGTLATGINGQKVLDPTVDNEVVDVINYEGIDTDKTYEVKTLGVNTAVIEAIAKDAGKEYSELNKKEIKQSLARVLLANPSLVLINQTEKDVKFDSIAGEYTVQATLKANTLKDGEGIVFFEYLTDTDLIKPVEPGKPTEPVIPTVEHEDPTEPGQTIKMVSKHYFIEVNKVDSISFLPIIHKDFSFEAEFLKDGVVVDSHIESGNLENGKAIFEFVGEGSCDEIRIKEKGAPDGYLLSDQVIIVTMDKFDSNNTYSFEYVNQLIPTTVVTGTNTNMNLFIGMTSISLLYVVAITLKKRKYNVK